MLLSYFLKVFDLSTCHPLKLGSELIFVSPTPTYQLLSHWPYSCPAQTSHTFLPLQLCPYLCSQAVQSINLALVLCNTPL